jgi:hypothetical protein
MCVYNIYIESKVARHAAAHVQLPLMVGILMTIVVLAIHMNFVFGYKIGYRVEWI